MTLPYANVAVRDGALGIVNPSASNVVALLGTSSSGTVGAVQAFTDIQSVKDALGTGPLVEAAGYVLAVAGTTVICVRVNATNAASSGAVTKVGTGTATVTTTGSAPLDSYLVQVLMVQGGASIAAGTATFKLSLDGGRTFGPETAVPTSGTYTGAQAAYGVTIVWSGATTMVAGDTYSWATVGPGYSTGDLQTAITALLNDARTWFLLYAVGIPADATATQGVHAMLATNLATAGTQYRFARALLQCADLSDANILTAVSALQDTRVMVAAGFYYGVSVTNGYQMKLPAASALAGRAAAVSPAEDLGRVASGNLKGIISLIRDEYRTPALDSVQLATLRTHVGLAGAYVTSPAIKAGLTSDFRLLQYGRVMDIASDTVRQAMLRFLNDAVRVNATTGLILEADAKAIEKYCEALLRSTVTQPGYASDCSVQLDRTVNVLSTQRLAVKFRIVPLGYARFIDGDLGFSNPALQLV
jgi:hypothetical protein